ncbi:MAG: hypothetical protein AAF551_08005 [Bacteroidota bacterium]
MAKSSSNFGNILTGKPGVLFLFTLMITLFLTFQLAVKYYPDFEGKNIPLTIIVNLIFLGLFNFLTYGLLFSVILTSTVIGFRKTNSRNDLIWVAICGLLIFLFASFIQPKLYARQLELLYAVKTKAPEDNFVVTSGLFEDQVATMTLTQLLEQKSNGNSRSIFTHKNPDREIVNMFSWPISILVFYLFGTTFGTRLDGISIQIKIVAVLFLIIPIWHFAGKYLNPISTTGTIKFILDRLLSELVLIGLMALIIKVSRRR